MNEQAANARCPRCARAFACGAAATAPCACTSLALGDALLARLRQQYATCLCQECLRELAAAEARVSAP